MGAYIARQPNGLLCRFSSVVDAVTHYNYSEEEYIELCAERAREEARRNLQDPHFVEPFDRVVDDVRFDNITYEEWVKQAGEMGYTEPDWKFKPGDWVIVHSDKDNTDGHEGEVWKSSKDKDGRIRVEVFIEELEGSWLFDESELTKTNNGALRRYTSVSTVDDL